MIKCSCQINRPKKLEGEDLTDGSNKTRQRAKECGGAGGEWIEIQMVIPVQVLGLVCERKLHKQPFEGLGLGGVFIVAFNFSCCYGTADFSFFLYPCGPVAT